MNPWIYLFAYLVHENLKTIDEVPEELREDVKKELQKEEWVEWNTL